MIQERDYTLIQQALGNLREGYQTDRSKELHVTNLIYCLTRSWFDMNAPLDPTPEEVMLFSLGWGLQKVLFPTEQEVEPIEVDEIICSPDFLTIGGLKAELKTTRMGVTRKDKITGQVDYSPLPETWVEQIKSYCYATKQSEYPLLVLHLMGNYAPPFPQLIGWRLQFSEQELLEHWQYILDRKAILEQHLESRIPPEPHTHCKEWECKNCRYVLACQTVSQAYKQEEKVD